jgi:hypothetical protein
MIDGIYGEKAMSFERRRVASDGITSTPIPREPAPAPDRHRARRQIPRDRGFPIALAVALAGLGLFLTAALIVGLVVWIWLMADWEEPRAQEPAFAAMEQKVLADEAPPQDWFPPDQAQGPWMEPLLPFLENPIPPPREPFRAQGRLVCLD